MNVAPVDAACDQMGKSFVHDSLPPLLTNGNLKGTVTRV